MANSTRRVGLLIAILALGTIERAQGATFVVSGDTNITNALTGEFVAPNPGNKLFFSNVLAANGGHHVLVEGTDFHDGVNDPVTNVNTYFNSVSGDTSTILSGPVTAAALAGEDLFVSALRSTPYTPSEIAALVAFKNSGGSIFLLGDDGVDATPQDTLYNTLALALGSTIQILPSNLDTGVHVATGAQIANTPLTSGVTSFTYALTSQVTGGTPLFFTTTSVPFVESQFLSPAAVPEPTSLTSAGIAGILFGLGYTWNRCRRKAA